MEVQYQRNHKESFMIIEENTYKHTFEEKMLKENQIRSLLSFYTMELDGKVQFWYEITGLQSLWDYFQQETVTLETLEQVFLYLMLAFEEIRKYLLDTSRIYLDPKGVFVQRQGSFRLYLCYCPFLTEEDGGMDRLTEPLLSIVDHNRDSLARLCYEIYEKSLQKETTLFELHQMVAAVQEQETPGQEEPQPSYAMQEQVDESKNEILEEEFSETPQWEEVRKKVKQLGCRLLEMIRQWNKGERPEPFLEKDFVIEPEPEACQPTQLLHAGEQLCQGRLLYQGQEQEEDFYISGNIFRIGSERSSNDGCINSQAVSRHHARISRIQQEFYLEDLNSTNGTMVNGKVINYQEKYRLSYGDQVQFADTLYRFI